LLIPFISRFPLLWQLEFNLLKPLLETTEDEVRIWLYEFGMACSTLQRVTVRKPQYKPMIRWRWERHLDDWERVECDADETLWEELRHDLVTQGYVLLL
jgi:hypothetical protein